MLKIRTACESDLPQIMLIEKLSFAPQIQESQKVFLERMKLCPKMFLIFYEADEDGQPEISPFESNGNNENNGNVTGYLCAEILYGIPQNQDELKLGHLPQKQLLDDSLEISQKNECYVYISSFAVFPSKRGGGTGKKCWNLAMEYFKNMNFEQNNAIIKGFLLLVNELWTKALTIYEKSGFEKIKTFKNFFDNGEKSFSDGILMKLDL